MNRLLGSVTKTLSATGALVVLGAATASAQLDTSLFGDMAARSIGPAGMSGRISAIEAVNMNPNIIYVGAATGGLWKSTTGGVTWTPVLDDHPGSSVGAVAIFQPAPDIVWVGTGEKGRRNSSGVGTGVYKSMDGGSTWKRVGLENSGAISEIVLHPSDPNVAYVAALGNTWKPSADRGIYKTTDGGATWTNVLSVNERTGAADLVMDPVNPNKLFAAMWEHQRWPWFFESGGPGSGLYLTWDGGTTWNQLTADDGLPDGNLGRIGLDIARSTPSVVYALVEAKRSALLRSDDGGRSWRTVNREPGIASRPFYYGQLRVDPENENRVYNVHSLIDISEDGGKNFETFVEWARVHPDHHALWINPLDGDLMIDGNDGGVYISRDRGQGWRFVDNLPLAQFYHINVDMATPFNVYGGLQDNGSWQGPSELWENGGIRFYHWKEVGFGDGFATLSDPRNPRYGYAMSQGGNLMRFDKETGEGKSIRPVHPDGTSLRFNWNAGIAIDPFDYCVYYGSQFVHKTCDMGHSWTIMSPDLTTNDSTKQRQLESGGLTYDVTNAENHTTIITIAPSPREQGVIWVGTDDGNVQLTRDGGATWTNVVSRIRGVPAATWVPHIEPSQAAGGTAYVVFDDHRRGNNAPYVFRTTDYGRSWRSLVTSDIEPFNFVHVIEEDPVTPNVLYLGTEYGMYVSVDAGARWTLWRHGLARAPVRALIVHPRDHDLVIGTHGRAAYILDDVRPFRMLAADPGVLERKLRLFQVPDATQHQVAQVGGIRFVADGMFIGENRPYGALLTYFVQEGSDSAKVTVEVLDDDEVIRKFEAPAATGINRATWTLTRDGFRRPRSGQEPPAEFLPSGPDVLPGRYAIRIIHAEDTVSAAVRVLEDPRVTVTVADRRAKHDMLMRAGRRIEVLTEATNRIRSAKASIGRILVQLEAEDDSASTALAEAGRELRDRLDDLQDSIGVSERETQGIRGNPRTAASRLYSAYGSLSSSPDAPTDAQRLLMDQGEQALGQMLDEVNTVFAEDVAAFDAQVRVAALEPFPKQEPLTPDWTPER